MARHTFLDFVSVMNKVRRVRSELVNLDKAINSATNLREDVSRGFISAESTRQQNFQQNSINNMKQTRNAIENLCNKIEKVARDIKRADEESAKQPP